MTSSDEILIRCEDVVVDFHGRSILSGINIQVGGADRVALLGPSGCGKSTLLNVFSGLLTPSRGNVQRSVSARDMSFVFQEPSLLPWKNVEDNVQVLLSLMPEKAQSSDSQNRIRDILTQVGLWERRRSFPDELSGGMKMRAAIARALILSPRLLLLDEPFSALDDITREKLQDDLLHLHAINRVSYVLVTHNMEEAALLADRIIVFSSWGTIIAELKVSDFFSGERARRDSQGVAAVRTAIRALWQKSGEESLNA